MILSTVHLKAQENSFGSKMAIGMQLNQFQDDFGIGLNISTPYLLNESLAIRVRANLVWHQHTDQSNEGTWTPYSNISIGFIGVGGTIGDFMRLYGEGGLMYVLPSDTFSSESSEFGGYGLFGFEFFLHQHGNYFIELGGIGIGANADKVPGSPIYSNGFLTSVGYRYQF